MKYWDASALVPLFVDEPNASEVRRLLLADPHVITWLWSRTELTSATERRVREGSVTKAQRHDILERLAFFASGWEGISDFPAVSSLANKLLAHHSLRSADAGQLAAALLAREKLSAPLEFVCLDKRLADAAEREGFRVLSGLPEQNH